MLKIIVVKSKPLLISGVEAKYTTVSFTTDKDVIFSMVLGIYTSFTVLLNSRLLISLTSFPLIFAGIYSTLSLLFSLPTTLLLLSNKKSVVISRLHSVVLYPSLDTITVYLPTSMGACSES